MNDLEIREVRIVRNRLKSALSESGLAQEEAARRAGVSYRHFNRVVLGHTDPSLLEAMAMALVLGKQLDELFVVKFKTKKARVEM
jgi:DNA-binding XRE family transcriptional regulator